MVSKPGRIHYKDCLFFHQKRCDSKGVSCEEWYEAMNMALIVGGSVVIPHWRYAFEILEKLFEDKTE